MMAVLSQGSASLEFAEQAAKIGFWDMDNVSGRVHWSHGMERIYGLPPGGFAGTAEDFIQRIHPDDVARNLQESQAALDARRPFDIRFRIVRSDGAVRWVNTRGAARWGEDGAFLGASGMQLDITEQVEREQQLRLQEQVIAHMAEGVNMISAATGCFVFANPRYEQMLGYAPGALLGQHVSIVNVAGDQDPQEVAARIIAELHRSGYWRGEIRNRCADGREIWITCTVTEFVHERLGRVWQGVQSDITAQRQAQLARDAALAELRRLSLNIQESIEAERVSVSREVHDHLGAALTGMRMQLEALATQVAALSPPLAGRLRDVADTASHTQLAARDICSRLRPAVLDDVGLLEACRWYLADWSDRVGLDAVGHFDALVVEPDGRAATDMFRVMQELLTNVARHARVQLSLSGDAGALTLHVQDDGHGFDVAQATAGFGLMGVRERLRHHGGHLAIESDTHGTRVRVTLPTRMGA